MAMTSNDAKRADGEKAATAGDSPARDANAGNGKVRLAAVGDLHAREGATGAYRELLAQICAAADVLLLCGDLTEHGLAREAEILAEDLLTCKMPIIAVLGNHDFESGQRDEVVQALAHAGVTVLDGESCEVHGVGFAGVKGFCGGFGKHVVQPWGEEIVKHLVQETINEALRLESALAKLETSQMVALLHYSPVRDTVEGEHPEVITYLGSSRLAEPIDRFAVGAVFHGHAHHGTLQGKTATGIPVYNASLPLLRRVRPDQPYALFEL
ncbi:MAG: metallophosphoesterase family protein [Chloroflexota bacterium]